METSHWLPDNCIFFFAVNCRKLQQPNGHPEVGHATSSTSNQPHLISRLLHKKREATFLQRILVWLRLTGGGLQISAVLFINAYGLPSRFQLYVCMYIFLYKSLVAEQLCDVAVKLPSCSNYVIICRGISALNLNLWGSGWTLNLSS